MQKDPKPRSYRIAYRAGQAFVLVLGLLILGFAVIGVLTVLVMF